MNVDEFRFSVSSLKTYRQCGTKFKYQKIMKLKADEEVSHFRWLGRLVHNCIYQSIGEFQYGEGMKSWKQTTDVPDVESAIELFNALWDESPRNDYEAKIMELEAGEKPVGKFFPKKKIKALNTDDQVVLEANWRKEAEKMVRNGVKVVADLLEKGARIVQIEYPLEFLFDGKKFTGFIDILYELDGMLKFLDFKTSWDKVTVAKLEEDAQFLLYAHSLFENLKLEYYPIGYLVHLRSATPIPLETTPQLLEEEIRKFKRDQDWLTKDLFFQDYNGHLCAYCDFFKKCYPERGNE